MFDVVRELAPHLRERQHMMLRSTVHPGTTREVARYLERLGCRVQLSYCPERIVQGYAITELEQLPQIVSGLNEESVDGALRLWGHLTDLAIVVEFEEAELAKLYLNEGLANFVVDSLRARYELAGKPVGILGMAFKANIDDTRDSLAYKLRKLLAFHGADVRVSDAFVEDPSFVSAEELVASSDVIVIGAPHDAYRDLVIPPGKHVVDVWGFLHEQLARV
jgi:UDP-N-acetyl-D-mannosaminuronate dehydrogenase